MSTEIEDNEFNHTQRVILAIFPKLTAFVTLVAAIWMARTSLRDRKRLYHRLVFAMSLYMISSVIWLITGSWAIPEGTEGILYATGTTATCSAQGFFLQVGYTGNFYFCFLSLYSFIAVRNNFDEAKYAWIEKWIHIGAHVYPIATAAYVLSIRGFNPAQNNSVCWIASAPFGCGLDSSSGIPCERGPDDISLVALVCAAIPSIFTLLFPIVMMTALYCSVRRRQKNILIQASTVAKQASIYLGVLVFMKSFGFINSGIQWLAGEKLFWASFLAKFHYLGGAYVALMYLYFRRKSTTTAANADAEGDDGSRGAADDRKLETAKMGAASQTTVDSTYSTFNIFDGTNAGGAFADFIFDGDSDDEEQDQEEHDKWDGMSGHL